MQLFDSLKCCTQKDWKNEYLYLRLQMQMRKMHTVNVC